jgi:hypothetical protein
VPVDDAVAQYRIASEANDIEALLDLLAPDAELVSPLSGRMVFRGNKDLRVLLTAVYGGMTGLRWREEYGDARHRVVIGDGRVGPLRMSDAMVFDLTDDGRIQRIRPHLRPWLAVTLFAILMGPKVARRPGVILRALARR